MTEKPSEIDRTTALAMVWIVAGLAAVLFVVLMMFFGDFGTTGPVFLGILIWGGLGFLLTKGIVDVPPPPKPGAFTVKGGAGSGAHPPREKSAIEKKIAEGAQALAAAASKAASDVGEVVKEKAAATKAAATGANSDEPGKPKLLSAARDGKPDDLKQIKGVGPKLEQTLHGMGVYHFDQIANWSEAEVAWVDENLEGFKGRVSRDDWVAQAKALTAGS